MGDLQSDDLPLASGSYLVMPDTFYRCPDSSLQKGILDDHNCWDIQEMRHETATTYGTVLHITFLIIFCLLKPSTVVAMKRLKNLHLLVNSHLTR